MLVGDSAGGNLCLGIALMCIKQKIRAPDGLILAYPAIDLNMKRFVP